jgi:hypothetical protein
MANIVKARLDATNKQIILEVVDDTTGATVTTYGQVALKLGADPGTTPTSPETAMGQPLAIRETKGCDSGGSPVYCFMLRSPWVAAALTADPET